MKACITFVTISLVSVVALAHDGPHEGEHGVHHAKVELPAAKPMAVADPVEVGGITYSVEPGWGTKGVDLPIGNTHGGIVVDPEGHVYYNTDTQRAIMVHQGDGSFVGSIASRYPGIHDMVLRVEDGVPYIYAAHLHGKQAVKLRMDGSLVWALGVPMESGKYDGNPNAYNPTAIAVAPDGRVYVADGYGQQWIHVFGPDLKYQSSFGGRGNGPGQFQTCHGLIVDDRGEQPMLIVCDRENRRLQRFDLDGRHVDTPVTGLRRPCALSLYQGGPGSADDRFAIAELEGRVTLLDGDMKVLGHLGDNPDRSQWASNPVPKDAWIEGIFTAPHGVCFDADGNIYVMDWNAAGRMTRLNSSQK